MRLNIPFTADEEERLRALAIETGRTVPRMLHFLALYGSAEYRRLIDQYGGGQADRIVVNSSRYASQEIDTETSAPAWPKGIDAKPSPTADDLPDLFGEVSQ